MKGRYGMITFKCPHCGKAFRVEDSAAGKHAKCPGCGKQIQVPAGSTPKTSTPLGSPPARAKTPSPTDKVSPDNPEKMVADWLGPPAPPVAPLEPSADSNLPQLDKVHSSSSSGQVSVESEYPQGTKKDSTHPTSRTYVPPKETNATPYIVSGVFCGVVVLVGIGLFASGILQIGRPKTGRITPSVESEKDAVCARY